MMKIFSIIFILTVVATCFAQDGSEPLNSCTQSDSPIIQGLRLGTSFASIKQDTKLELSKKTIAPGKQNSYIIYSPNKNVKYMYLEFYKNQLSSIMVGYSKTIEWDSSEEFASKTLKSLNISASLLKVNFGYGSAFLVLCTHFGLALGNNESGYFIHVTSDDLSSQEAEDKVKEESRKRTVNQKRKEIFKP